MTLATAPAGRRARALAPRRTRALADTHDPMPRHRISTPMGRWARPRKVSAAAAGPWRLLLAAVLSPAAPPAAPVMPAAGPIRPVAIAPLRHALVRRGPPA
ncbi:MAG TPA: hypothetical protein VFV01_05300 [Spirillospora sp.]|nr:hypothetical protein [Spirillospora sp.]